MEHKPNVVLHVALFLLVSSGTCIVTTVAKNWGVPDPSRTITKVVVHHTAGTEPSVEAIRDGHLRRGFQDVAYHYVVFPDGRIETGRSVTKLGAGVFGRHEGMVEVVLVGELHKHPPTRRQFEAAAQLAARWCLRFGLTSDRVYGHREVAATGHGTLCPGLELQGFRKQVVREMGRLVK